MTTTTLSPSPTLATLTRPWFLFLGAYRRNVAQMPADSAWVRAQLRRLLHEMDTAAANDSALQHKLRAARHALAYFADEVLLNCRWAGEGAWARELLETELFGTQHAGRDFFERLHDPSLQDREVLEVYFQCLCLGFRGALTRKPLQLREERELLAARIGVGHTVGPRFCREAYEHTDARNFNMLPVVAVLRIAVIAVLAIACIYATRSWLIRTTVDGIGSAAAPAAKTQ